MDQALDLVRRCPLEPNWRRFLNGASADFAGWLADALGHRPADLASFERALTHGSRADARNLPSYERLEFLGDRVLGLAMADWLYHAFPGEAEGELSKRFHQLVSGATCAAIAREIDVPRHLRLSKQGRDDGAADSDKVLGDVIEALLGALYLDAGLSAARTAIERWWHDRIDAATAAPQHPKSALQEWAAANRRKPPAYEITDRSGPDHARRFTIRVSIGADNATATGGSKQDAETAAAAALLAILAR